MFGHKSNIFVSISPGYEYAEGEKKRYLRPHHAWMLSVVPANHNILPHARKDASPTHYSVIWDENEDEYRLHKVLPTNLGIAGSVLIQRNAHITAEKLFHQLEADLQDQPLELDGSEGSEHWVRFALQALQHDNIVEDFDVEMFMTFSQAYLARRMDGEGPAKIAYSRLHKDHSQKEKKSFWVSYPQKTSNYDSRDVYGGLM